MVQPDRIYHVRVSFGFDRSHLIIAFFKKRITSNTKNTVIPTSLIDP